MSITHVKEVLRCGIQKQDCNLLADLPMNRLADLFKEVVKLESEMAEHETTVLFYRSSVEKDSSTLMKV